MGNLVTLDLPEDSPLNSLPWIITFGAPDATDDWEPVVCGPYDRQRALSLAESILADDEFVMAVVEPITPHESVEAIRSAIDDSITRAEQQTEDEDDEYWDSEEDDDGYWDSDEDGQDDAYEEDDEDEYWNFDEDEHDYEVVNLDDYEGPGLQAEAQASPPPADETQSGLAHLGSSSVPVPQR